MSEIPRSASCKGTSATSTAHCPPRWLDAVHRAGEQPVSYWDAQGCGICPEFCRRVRIQRLPPGDLLADYYDYALIAGYRIPGRW